MDQPEKTAVQPMDWMLQNSQVSDQELAIALMERFYSGLYALALARIGQVDLARQAAAASIAAAVQKRHTFWGETFLPVWLYQHSLHHYRRIENRQSLKNAWQSFKNLLRPAQPGDRSTRTGRDGSFFPHQLRGQELTAWVLRFAGGLTIEEIAAVLGEPEGKIYNLLLVPSSRLRPEVTSPEASKISVVHRNTQELWVRVKGGGLAGEVQRELEAHLQNCVACHAWSIEFGEMESIFKGELAALHRSPEHRSSRAAIEIEGLVNRRKVRRKWIVSAKEAALALLAIGLIGGVAGLANYLLPTPDGVNPGVNPSITQKDLPEERNFNYFYVVKEGDTLLSIAREAKLPLDELIQLNDLHGGVNLTPGKVLTLSWNPSASGSMDRSLPVPALTVLTAQATEAEIWERIFDSSDLWESLWADVSVVQYGPPGYTGTPLLSSRWQMWLRKPSDSVLLSPTNPNTGMMSLVYNLGGVTFWKTTDSDKIFADFKRARPEGQFWTDQVEMLTWMRDSGSLSVVGSDRVADRPALVVDWENRTGSRWIRIWVDSALGLILRHRQLNGDDTRYPVFETTYHALVVNMPLPEQVFSPFEFDPPGFALDYSGTTFETTSP